MPFACEGQKIVYDDLEEELQMAVNYHECAVKSTYSARATHSLNCWAISPTPENGFISEANGSTGRLE